MRLLRRTALVSVLFASSVGAAAPVNRSERAPDGIVYARFEVGRTEFKCRFTSVKHDSVDCEFVQVSIHPHADVDAAVRQASSELDRELAKKGPSTVVAEFQKSCSDLKPKVDKAEARQLELVKGNPQGSWYFADFKSAQTNLKRMCACETVDCIQAAAIDAAKDEARTCKFWITSYKTTFVRDRNSWTNVDTSTACYSTITTTLVSEKESLWTMRVTKVPRPDSKNNKACIGDVVDILSTWEDPGTFRPDCLGFKWNWLF